MDLTSLHFHLWLFQFKELFLALAGLGWNPPTRRTRSKLMDIRPFCGTSRCAVGFMPAKDLLCMAQELFLPARRATRAIWRAVAHNGERPIE